MNEKRLVVFISAEDGDDLIVSFALTDPDDPEGVQSLTLLRTPKYEFILEEWERGVRVGLECMEPERDDYLEGFDYDREGKRVRLKTANIQYELDVRKVAEKELKRMGEVVRKMNFDGRFKVSGLAASGEMATHQVNLHKLSHNELLTRCAWCHRVIPEDSEVFGAGTRIQPEFKAMLKRYEGKMFPLPLKNGREIIAGVPTGDSEAHKAGHDVYFQACCEQCCQELREAVNAELAARKN